MNNIIIFLDLDGVLSDFEQHAIQQNKYRKDGKLNYDALTHDWWASMPICDGALDFYEELKKLAKVKFLTGPMINPQCYSGKAEWILNFDKNKGKFALMDLIICPSKAKHLLAGKNRILIDDRKSNIEDWINAGGIAIHHIGDFQNTMKKLNNIFDKKYK